MGATEITAFLSDLAIRRKVAASTQNQLAVCFPIVTWLH
jgi:hypothetical protein